MRKPHRPEVTDYDRQLAWAYIWQYGLPYKEVKFQLLDCHYESPYGSRYICKWFIVDPNSEISSPKPLVPRYLYVVRPRGEERQVALCRDVGYVQGGVEFFDFIVLGPLQIFIIKALNKMYKRQKSIQ